MFFLPPTNYHQFNFAVFSGDAGHLPCAGDQNETLPLHDAPSADPPQFAEHVISPVHSAETKRKQFQNSGPHMPEKTRETEPSKETSQQTPEETPVADSVKPDPPTAPKTDADEFTASDDDKAGM